MDKFVHVGKGNIINSDDIAVILFPKTAECKRRIIKAQEEGTLIHLNRRKKVRSVIITKSGYVMPCILSYAALLNRLNGRADSQQPPIPEEPEMLPPDIGEDDEEASGEVAVE